MITGVFTPRRLKPSTSFPLGIRNAPQLWDVTNEFDGSDDPTSADTVCFWLGDHGAVEAAFRCAFLFDPMNAQTARWVYADDEFLSPRDFESRIFPRDRSSFYYRHGAAKPDYIVPLPWCVDLIGE